MLTSTRKRSDQVEARVRLRVHFAPIGFEVQRVTTPAKSLRADVVLLLTTDRTEKAGSALERVIRRLDAARIRHHVVRCDIWDSPSVVDEVGGIVTAAPQHDYFFNVSTGAKTACIAGTIASMFWQVRPYYQPVAYVNGPVTDGGNPPVEGLPVFIPTFEAPSLEPGPIETLRFLVERSRPVSKRELMIHMRTAETIYPRTKSHVTPQALHAQADVILHRLADWGFIEITGSGRRMLIRPTETGRGGERMFRHVTRPRPALELLKV